MIKKRELEIASIKNVIIESSASCFAVTYESDCSGYHYVIYTEKEATNLEKLKSSIISLNLLKRVIIILSDVDYIEFKLAEQNEKN